MLSFILLLWFALCVLEPFLTMHQIQHCHLLLFAGTFCGSVFPAFVLAFLFAHNVVMFQYDASGFCGHVVLHGSYAGLSWDCSLCLAMLFVIHLFWCVLRLIDQTGYASNSALSVFPLCQLKCCNASKAHSSHVLSAFTIITISIWMSVCEIQRNGTLSKTTI